MCLSLSHTWHVARHCRPVSTCLLVVVIKVRQQGNDGFNSAGDCSEAFQFNTSGKFRTGQVGFKFLKHVLNCLCSSLLSFGLIFLSVTDLKQQILPMCH